MSSGPLFSTIWEADQFVRGGAVDEGLTLIASALTTRADDPYVHFSHAVLLAAKGRRTEAEAIARRFERDAKTAPVVARFAARIFMTLGDPGSRAGSHGAIDGRRRHADLLQGRTAVGTRPQRPPVQGAAETHAHS
jgi:hypothetical protein